MALRGAGVVVVPGGDGVQVAQVQTCLFVCIALPDLGAIIHLRFSLDGPPRSTADLPPPAAAELTVARMLLRRSSKSQT